MTLADAIRAYDAARADLQHARSLDYDARWAYEVRYQRARYALLAVRLEGATS